MVTAGESGVIDRAAQDEWGFNSFSLIESAGRQCAQVLAKTFPRLFEKPIPQIVVFAGSGNNGADALAMLRYWLLTGVIQAQNSMIFACTIPEKTTPPGSLIFSVKKMQVPVIEYVHDGNIEILPGCIILDGIAGTGVRCPLGGVQALMAEKINSQRCRPDAKSLIVSVDVPSGLSDDFYTGMPIVRADVTLAIEPQKICLYNPAARPFAGRVLPVSGIFPKALLDQHKGPQLLDWENAAKNIKPVNPDSHKYDRGCIEIHAGSAGSAGAALIAGRGAQAAGAGIVRLVIDDDIYPVIAPGAGGIMVCPSSKFKDDLSTGNEKIPKRFKPDSVLLGPGWGRDPVNENDRNFHIKIALEYERSGTPLVLDADGIYLTRDKVFTGNTLLTPHIGEFAALTGLTAQEILNRPVPVLLKTAAEKNAFILLKSHVMFIAAPDGRLAVIDGMTAALATGGSGDLLAGFCTAIAGRAAKNGCCDLFDCAAAAAALLVKAGSSVKIKNRFLDPLELADEAAELAGSAWLPGGAGYG